MALGPSDRENMNEIETLMEGPVEQRLRASLSALAKAETQLSAGELVDMGPMARAIAALAVDIQALPATEGQRMAPMLEVLSDGLRALAEGLSARAKACEHPMQTGPN